MVWAIDDGPAPSCTSADITSWSSERGYTCPTLVKTVEKPKKSATRPSSSASLAAPLFWPPEQVAHVLRGPHRPLDAAQRVAVDQLSQPGQRDQRFLCCGGEPLAQGGGLGGDVVAASGHHQIAVGRRPLGKPRDHRHPV